MPFVITRVSCELSKEKERELKRRFGQAIALVPGKSESYLLCGFEDECHLYIAGDDSQPIAYVEASVFGNESHAGYDRFGAAVTQAIEYVLDIRPDHVYLRYADIPDWGVGGMNYDRNMYR